MTTEKQDVYTRITNTIVASLEQGVRPWIQPWSNGQADARIMRPLRHNGQPYSGINVLMLWASAAAQGFTSPFWMTFNQALELDAHVRKGAKGSLIVYANRITRTEKNDDGDEVEHEIPFLKGYTVFNVEQIEGLPESFRTEPAPLPNRVERIAHADEFFANTGLTIRHGGDQAFYSESADYVQMPPVDIFVDALSYYSTLGHEAVHATKASHRLNRDFGRKTWGDVEYALQHQQNLKALIISNMMASVPEYNEYARRVLMPAMDQKVLAEIKQFEAAGKYEDPRYMNLLMPNFYAQHLLRMPPDQWPDPVKRAFKHMNGSVYVPMQGPSELGASGKLENWDRTADLDKITVPTLVIGARYDTMDPAHMEQMSKKVKRGRYLFCPNGSHLAEYDDQKTYMKGLIDFIHDVDQNRF